jgi:hypothetical protein
MFCCKATVSRTGGIDYRLIRPVAWRFEADYLQTRFFGTTQDNVRWTTGIAFHF